MLDSVVSLFTHYGPFIFFGILFLCSFGLPLAKSLVIVTAGILAGRGSGDAMLLFLSASIGLHMGDFGVFLLGRHLGADGLRKKPLNRFVRERHVDMAERFIAHNGLSALLLARVAPFVRGPCYFLLGSLKMSIMRFQLINYATSCIYTLTFFLMGYYMGNREDELLQLVRSGNVLLVAILLMVSAVLLWRRYRGNIYRRFSPNVGDDL